MMFPNTVDWLFNQTRSIRAGIVLKVNDRQGPTTRILLRGYSLPSFKESRPTRFKFTVSASRSLGQCGAGDYTFAHTFDIYRRCPRIWIPPFFVPHCHIIKSTVGHQSKSSTPISLYCRMRQMPMVLGFHVSARSACQCWEVVRNRDCPLAP